jgi:hypothetical protein
MRSEDLEMMHVQIKYVYEHERTKAMFVDLYTEMEGVAPDTQHDLLNWFFDRYEYSVVYGHWQPKQGLLVH